MEVADQWRKQWAGTAEYGKVTEGGVTRRVARAMEVLHASAPGSRVRVMRAAYHSSAGPGTPSESFMLHSSRRVISSGFNFLEPPSLPIKPLEISSTPLELMHDSNGETENYKVTEPDDLEISEPSKWRGSTRGSSIRMPSEESSSTDNASIIDLDSRSSKNLYRKYSYDSESSDVQFRSRSNSRTSQLLDAPAALSTLKYKSLLNSSNEWNTRRKSYSFEDTSPLNETILHSNDTLAMESSTDSGICKSTEIMNDHVDDNTHNKYFGKDDRKPLAKEESFKDWLTKNRQSTQYRGTKFKTYREHEIVMEDPKENKIALQSSGKVSITLPVTLETDDDNPRKIDTTEDNERRVKRVEFCKTEVHFAAESGKVNIIATDEKPPPTNDFRRRRSAFVPMQDIVDRPITLFGERSDLPVANEIETSLIHSNGDFGESDENTAATKSILKNKIPKPKPYLLGENMDFGNSNDVSNISANHCLTAVTLVNQQLESEKRYKTEAKSIFSKEQDVAHTFRTINSGPIRNDSLKREKHTVNIKVERSQPEPVKDIKHKLSSLHVAPAPVKPKTRQLRDSDLTYFGIDGDRKVAHETKPKPAESKFTHDSASDSIFNSVKLIQQVSSSACNSVCNSEPDSEEAPEYQNIPLNINRAPVPTPRLRSIYDNKPSEIAEVRAGLKPIVEKQSEEVMFGVKSSTRRTKVRRQEETKSSRSISEPPKNFRRNSSESSHRDDQKSSSRKNRENVKNVHKESFVTDKEISEEDIPIYVNLKSDTEELNAIINRSTESSESPRHRPIQKTNSITRKAERHTRTSTSEHNRSHKSREHRPDSGTDSGIRRKNPINKETLSSSLKKEKIPTRGEKSNKYEYNIDRRQKVKEDAKHNEKTHDKKYKNEENDTIEKKEHISRSMHKSEPKSSLDESTRTSRDHSTKNRDASSHRKKILSNVENNYDRNNVKSKLDSDSSPQRSSERIKNHDRLKEVGSKSSSHRHNKHREIVINYDDKNGTVSSICKIKPGLGTPKRKKTSKEILKDHKDSALKTKTVDKIPLLELQDHQGDPNGLIYADRKWKTRVHLQRSCQLL